MNTIRYLTDPDLRSLYWPGVAAGLAIGALCAWLSVLVVLKRLAFIGQGVSHAAFGGMGVAAVLGLTALSLTPAQSAAQFAVVVAFCTAAALLVGLMAQARGPARTHADTAIGVILVFSMALGAILARYSASGIQWESFLFGSLINTTWRDASIALSVAAVVLGTLWFIRRPLAFWAFDEPSAIAFGVRVGRVRLILMVLLALATVTAMKLAGVVLASALLILPGAVALKLSSRSGPVLALSMAVGVGSVAAGLVVSFELDWPPGPAVVAVLTLLFAAASVTASRVWGLVGLVGLGAAALAVWFAKGFA